MPLDRSELMKATWATAKDRMQRFCYAQRQLRAVILAELARAWRKTKRRARLAQRSIFDITAKIAFLENKTQLGADGLGCLPNLRQAQAARSNATRLFMKTN